MADMDALTAEEVAKILRVSRNTVYNLVKRDELASYFVGRKMRFSMDDVENYIARSSVKQELHPEPLTLDEHSNHSSFAIAGNDIVGDMMANYLGATLHMSFERIYKGSYAALVDVFAGRAQAALVHLRDPSGEYNVSFVKRMLPGMRVRLVRIVKRRQGLIVAKGNPKNLRSWADLGRGGIRIANRERGCGSRVLLDEMLERHGIDREVLVGYGREYPTALRAAALVARGAADVCVGSERTYHQVEGVDFLPLQDEWLDAALSLETRQCIEVAEATCRLLRTRAFSEDVGQLVGYNTSCMGQIIFEQ